MYSEQLEALIESAIADGVLTDQERAVLHKRAQAEGVDPDELDIIIDGRLAKMKKQEASLRPAQPKESVNQKYGNVLKCPSCGAQVVAGSAVCPECGYAFTNIKANSSIERLQEKLEEFNRRQESREDAKSANSSVAGMLGLQYAGMLGSAMGLNNDATKSKMNIITTFPVPNTRADLLEFMAMLLPMAKSTGPQDGRDLTKQEDMSYAYWVLFVNCINKARISFSKDPDFGYYFTKYEEELQKTKGIKGLLRSKVMKYIMIIGGVIILNLFLIALANM